MADHTPGPWMVYGCRYKWREASHDQVLDAHAVGPGGDAVCLAFYTPKHHGEQIANARLISAAPDLLEALKAVVNSDMAMREEDEGNVSSVLFRARAAISKATDGHG